MGPRSSPPLGGLVLAVVVSVIYDGPRAVAQQAEAIRLERVPDGTGDAHGDGHQRSTHLVVDLEEVLDVSCRHDQHVPSVRLTAIDLRKDRVVLVHARR